MKFSSTAVAFSLVAAIANAKAVPFANPIAFAAELQHGSEYSNTMGEIAMLYPDDREWSEDAETVAPCGSFASISNISDFPLDDGFVALVAKTTSAWSVSLKISYNEDPTSNDDFDEWASGNVTNDVDIGHTCFYLPDQPSSVNVGDKATIQLLYMALEDDSNVTHYACADITFVEESVFKTSTYALSCFNATDDSYYSVSDYGAEDPTTQSSSAASTASSTSSSSSRGEGASLQIAGVAGVGAAIMALNYLI